MANECAVSINKIFTSKNSRGFMGLTHALSAVAAVGLITVFAPQFMLWLTGTESIPLYVLSLFVIAGGALVPDLDNTSSTAKSALGPLGNAVSVAFRSSSRAIQTTIRTRRDDPDPNPHRGAWHSPIFCIALAYIVYIFAKVPIKMPTPLLKTYTVGEVFTVLFTSTLILIGFSGLFKKIMKSIKSKGGALFGDILAFAVSFAFTVSLYSLCPADINPMWLPVSFYIGMVIHHIGDGFTTAGCPFLAPIPFRGKLWWNFRIPPHIRAGGAAENYLFIPLFIFIIAASALRVAFGYL